MSTDPSLWRPLRSASFPTSLVCNDNGEPFSVSVSYDVVESNNIGSEV